MYSLEIERFDHLHDAGRRGVVSLGTLEAEFLGLSRNWSEAARALRERDLISEDVFERMLWRYHFGN